MSTYLCPSCAGRGSVGVYSRTGGQVDAISTTTCLTCGGSGSIKARVASGSDTTQQTTKDDDENF